MMAEMMVVTAMIINTPETLIIKHLFRTRAHTILKTQAGWYIQCHVSKAEKALCQ